MIDVCLWRNQEGAQINFSLSSIDLIRLICFLTPLSGCGLTNGQWDPNVVCGSKLLLCWEISLAV